MGQSGIYANSIAPGGVDTEMTRAHAYPVEGLPVPLTLTLGDDAETTEALARILP